MSDNKPNSDDKQPQQPSKQPPYSMLQFDKAGAEAVQRLMDFVRKEGSREQAAVALNVWFDIDANAKAMATAKKAMESRPEGEAMPEEPVKQEKEAVPVSAPRNAAAAAAHKAKPRKTFK